MRNRLPDYRTQAVRDLAWALSSPGLVDHPIAIADHWGVREIQQNQGLLARLDTPGSALVAATEKLAGDGVGTYFETLLSTWIDQAPPATLVAVNRQVHGGPGTVGEFDLVFRRDRAVHHWELAVKFYLGHPGPGGQSCWSGPDPTDRLDQKWNHMLCHQLQLSDTAEGRAELAGLGIDEHVQPRAFIKGYLFEPLDESLSVTDSTLINPRGPRGWWVHHRQLAAFQERLAADHGRRWISLPRRRWLSPARVLDGDQHTSFEMLQRLLSPRRPTLVAGLHPTDGGWREITRGFVVPDRWPRA